MTIIIIIPRIIYYYSHIPISYHLCYRLTINLYSFNMYKALTFRKYFKEDFSVISIYWNRNSQRKAGRYEKIAPQYTMEEEQMKNAYGP